jgi:ribosomal protein S24E
MSVEQEIKYSMVMVSKLFEKRYGHMWVQSNDEDRDNLEEKLYLWVEELSRINAKPDQIEKVAEILVNQKEFSDYPPILNKFIAMYKEFSLMFASGDDGLFYKSMKLLDEKFTFTYGSLWNIREKDKSRRKIEHWLAELKEQEIDATTIQHVSKKIGNKPSYVSYPPTLGQFIIECKFHKIGEDYVDPDIAYRACYDSEINNVIIKTTKSKIGGYEFRASTDNRLKIIFTKMYLIEVQNYCDDKESYLLINSDKGRDRENKEEVELTSHEDSSAFIEQLINNLTTK